MGQVCRKHEEFYEEACRWCEPEPTGIIVSPLARASEDSRIQTVKDMIASGLLYGVSHAQWNPATPPPLMNIDACPSCGRSGLEIMQAGETYKTHKCFRVTP